MSDEVSADVRDLLTEIRDLLRPVADAYQDDFDRRVAEREVQRVEAIRGLLSTEKRKKAWELADGTRSLTTIAKQSALAKGGASTFFKSLRELGAISEGSNPTRTIEIAT